MFQRTEGCAVLLHNAIGRGKHSYFYTSYGYQIPYSTAWCRRRKCRQVPFKPRRSVAVIVRPLFMPCLVSPPEVSTGSFQAATIGRCNCSPPLHAMPVWFSYLDYIHWHACPVVTTSICYATSALRSGLSFGRRESLNFEGSVGGRY